MSNQFQTTPIQILIENVTYAGSAFGITDKGEAVFINKRIVENQKIEIEDVITAHCVPNYEDKRDDIPWMCIRAERPQPEPKPEPERTAEDINQAALKFLKEDPENFWTTAEVAEDIDADTKTTGNALLRLFNAGKITRAEVHSKPNQDRASWNLWAATSDPFK